MFVGLRARWLRAAVFFVLSVTLAYFLNISLTHVSEPSLPGTKATFTESLFAWPQTYQRFVTTWGHSDLVPKDVSLVMITEKNEPRFTDPCEQRRLVAALLDALKESPVRVIVLDKVFKSDLDCLEPGKAADPTKELQRAVWEASQTKPLVIGLAAEGDHIAASLAFPSGGHLSWGVAHRAKDYREVPLVWNLYPSGQHGGGDKPQPFRSLPYAAALARQPIDEQSDRILNFVRSGVRPMTSFIPANAPNGKDPRMLPVFSAGYVICGENVLPHLAALDSCVQEARQSAFNRAFLTDVVVVGEASEKLVDVHPTVIGSVAGAVLVANYIESILGPDRLFRAAGPLANVALGLAVYACLMWVLATNQRWWAKLLWLVALFAATFAIIVEVFAVSRFYLEPVTVSLSGIVVSLFRPIYDRMIKRSRKVMEYKTTL